MCSIASKVAAGLALCSALATNAAPVRAPRAIASTNLLRDRLGAREGVECDQSDGAAPAVHNCSTIFDGEARWGFGDGYRLNPASEVWITFDQTVELTELQIDQRGWPGVNNCPRSCQIRKSKSASDTFKVMSLDPITLDWVLLRDYHDENQDLVGTPEYGLITADFTGQQRVFSDGIKFVSNDVEGMQITEVRAFGNTDTAAEWIAAEEARIAAEQAAEEARIAAEDEPLSGAVEASSCNNVWGKNYFGINKELYLANKDEFKVGEAIVAGSTKYYIDAMQIHGNCNSDVALVYVANKPECADGTPWRRTAECGFGGRIVTPLRAGVDSWVLSPAPAPIQGSGPGPAISAFSAGLAKGVGLAAAAPIGSLFNTGSFASFALCRPWECYDFRSRRCRPVGPGIRRTVFGMCTN